MKAKESLGAEVGGKHYKNYKIQPIELIIACRWDFCQGNIAKYTLRAKYKNGNEDLQKANHYCQLAQDLEAPDFGSPRNRATINMFCTANDISDDVRKVLHLIDGKAYGRIEQILCNKELRERYL